MAIATPPDHLNPENAQIHYAKLLENAEKLPANPATTEMIELIKTLPNFIGDEAEIKTPLSGYFKLSAAILEHNSIVIAGLGTNKQKFKPTKNGKLLSAIGAYTNNLCTFLNDDGDEVAEEVLQKALSISEALSGK